MILLCFIASIHVCLGLPLIFVAPLTMMLSLLIHTLTTSVVHARTISIFLPHFIYTGSYF